MKIIILQQNPIVKLGDEADRICSSEYSFAYPDERFVEDMGDWDEIEIYEMNVEAYVEEISKEEYLEAIEWGY